MKKFLLLIATYTLLASSLFAQAPRIIPVVFHILHQYGLENISDAQVQDAIRILNEDYQARNSDTSLVIPPHKPLIGNCNVEFRLATKDPNGNCTNGIEHIYTYLTNNGGDSCKINQWPRDKYLNVWTVKSFNTSGIAAYTYTPSAANAPPFDKLDGITVLSDYVGSIGTSSPLTSRALTHEVGHFLGLLHLGGATCQDGDGIPDTPPTTWQTVTCSPTPPTYPEWRICDTAIIENQENFMVGGYCQYMFTHGQATYVNQILNTNISNRVNLWSDSNLLATGTDSASFANPPLCKPTADFFANKYYVCEGGTVNFTDASFGATVAAYNWTFANGTPATSSIQNPTATFNTWGWQQVSLTVSNTSGSDTKTVNTYILVSPPWYDYWATFTEDFETPTFDNLWIKENKENVGSTWVRTNTAGVSGTHSVLLNDYVENINGVIDAMISPSVNLSTCSNMTLQFKYACATRTTTTTLINERLRVYVSYNCGTTWFVRRSITGTALANNGFYLSFFTPNNSSIWTTCSIPLIAGDMQPNVRFRFEYTAGDYSNAIYIDDINLNGTLGVNEIGNSDLALNIFPNPSNRDQETIISYELKTAGPISISITDLLGREVFAMKDQIRYAGENKLVLDKEKLLPGIYMVKIYDGNNFAIKRMVIGD